ncbi:MAG: aminotransferase class III-fold pyridoxal phosphate-dependent enzyme, partial [Sphingomonas sp.]
THRPAEDLARRLLARLGGPFEHVFFSDSGSTAVEVALKMALGFWRNQGERRIRIIALEHAYHGDTIGTMSTGARGVFNASYEPLLFDVVRLPFPEKGAEDATLSALRGACRDGGTAALIVEPLLLGAGGMLGYLPYVLREMQSICRETGALLIADEVMTGFGRTGTFTACEQAAVRPDIMCLAKGITGGSMPLAVTVCTRAIFDAHYSTDRTKTFFHSSSYTANPIACAAAVANLDVWEEEPVQDRIRALSEWQEDFIAGFADDT